MPDDMILSLMRNKLTQDRGFRLLMQKYQERLYWHVRRMVTEHEDANDVIQNCFIKVFRNISSFEGKSKLYTWLYRIATNEALTFLNRKKRKSTASIDEGELDLANQLKADTYFDGDSVQIHLQKALSRLPQKQRLVFNMRYYDAMSYQEISGILETSVGALKASYHHAVKKVERYLKGVEDHIGY
ncbi:MAG: RNA polymerase sigma factor [Bacteroidetes bacterium]|nr:RNA polymerase sigma factor [Bacteroidota bacterium]